MKDKQKEFKEEDTNEKEKDEEEMAKRIKIGNKYYVVRERSSSKGRKGTIKGKWKPKRKRKKSFLDLFR